MTITSNSNTTANMQNSLLKREDIDKSSENLNVQIAKESKEETKAVNYSNFLGTNLDIKV